MSAFSPIDVYSMLCFCNALSTAQQGFRFGSENIFYVLNAVTVFDSSKKINKMAKFEMSVFICKYKCGRNVCHSCFVFFFSLINVCVLYIEIILIVSFCIYALSRPVMQSTDASFQRFIMYKGNLLFSFLAFSISFFF